MAIPQGVRMAGQVLGALGGVAKAYPAQAALLGGAIAAPPVLGYTHGRVAGYNDPSKGGLGGTVGYGFFGSPLAGLAYGLGHQGGREAATNAAGAMPTEEQRIEEYLRKRESRQRLLQSIMKPSVVY